jgi:hypothetical protein
MIGSRRGLFALGSLAIVAALIAVAALKPWSGSPQDPGHRSRRAAPADRGVRSPRCTPSTLNRSATVAGTPLSVSPLPGTMVAAPSSQISLLGVPLGQISAVSVSGSRSGRHAGELRGYSQDDGASYIPQRPFAPGERVDVRGTLHLASGTRRFAFSFTVAHEDPLLDRTARYTPSRSPTGLQRFHSRPDLQAPTLHVRTPARGGAAPGDLFLAAYATSNGPGGPLIFDSTGRLVWFKALPAKVSAANLQVQQYRDNSVLTWWQGHVLPQGFGEGEEIIESRDYKQLAVVHAANGLHADLHDFQITPQNTGLLTAFDPLHCDLSSVGGPRGGAITDGVYQEIDLATGLVRREWHALDHVTIANAYPKAHAGKARTAFPFDFFHINTVGESPGGIVTVSARNTWTIYRIDADTGKVLTQIGGKRSTVRMGVGTTTAWQHDARVLPDGDISVFDNGAEPKIHPQSRGIVERLDASTNTISLRAQYTHSPAISAGTQGNVQTLPNGNVVIGWGADPHVSEYSAAGGLEFDASLSAPDQSYRAFRFPWAASPASSPRLTVAKQASGKSVAYASWNGATRVESWRLLTGSTATRLTPVASIQNAGFETTIPVKRRATWFEVQALGHSGTVLGSSAPSRSR